MSLIISQSEVQSIDRVVAHLLANKLAIMPCDTIYGIVGIAPETEQDLKKIKGREETKPFIQLVTLEMAKTIALEPIDERILQAWPGPLTVIVKNTLGTTTAIRVPADAFLQAILEQIAKPMYSSSVNVAGESPLTSFAAMYERFCKIIPLFVQGNTQQGTTPSTIIDITTTPYRLIRQGVLNVNSLLSLDLG